MGGGERQERLGWFDEARPSWAALAGGNGCDDEGLLLVGTGCDQTQRRKRPPEERGGAAEIALAVSLSQPQEPCEDAVQEFNAFRLATTYNYVENGDVGRAMEGMRDDHWQRCDLVTHRYSELVDRRSPAPGGWCADDLDDRKVQE